MRMVVVLKGQEVNNLMGSSVLCKEQTVIRAMFKFYQGSKKYINMVSSPGKYNDTWNYTKKRELTKCTREYERG